MHILDAVQLAVVSLALALPAANYHTADADHLTNLAVKKLAFPVVEFWVGNLPTST